MTRSETDVAVAGKGTYRFPQPIGVHASATVVGKMEAEGPFGSAFDRVMPDDLFGERTWEQAERKCLLSAAELALQKAGLKAADVDLCLAGDLLDQLTTSNFAARNLQVPFLGVFAACATSGATLALGAIFLATGLAEWVLVATASHHLTAERQYRYPVELGNQRKPTQHWTATGGAAFVLGRAEAGLPRLTAVTIGRVVDLGQRDVNDMGSAMAPAAADTIRRHLQHMREQVEDYDVILTGDLGGFGSELLVELLRQDGVEIEGRQQDCGLMLYDRTRQDVHAGGSGTVCSALILAAPIYQRLADRRLRRVLFVPTGSLHSVTTYQQGETIPTIAHAVVLEAGDLP